MSSVTKTLRINTSHMLVRELADTLLRHPNLPLDDLINGLWNGLQGIIDHVETGLVDNHEITSTRFIMIDCPNWDMNLLTQQLHVVISDLSQQNDLSTRQARLQRACEIILESITANKPCDLSPLGNATSVEYHLLKCVKYRVVKSVPGKDYMPDDDDWEYVDGPYPTENQAWGEIDNKANEAQKNSYPDLGKWITDTRKAGGMTLSQLSTESGVSKALISRHEAHKNHVSFIVFYKYVKALGLDIEDVFTKFLHQPAPEMVLRSEKTKTLASYSPSSRIAYSENMDNATLERMYTDGEALCYLDISRYLRNARSDKGLSYREWPKCTGLSSVALNKYEKEIPKNFIFLNILKMDRGLNLDGKLIAIAWRAIKTFVETGCNTKVITQTDKKLNKENIQ